MHGKIFLTLLAIFLVIMTQSNAASETPNERANTTVPTLAEKVKLEDIKEDGTAILGLTVTDRNLAIFKPDVAVLVP